MVEPRVRLPVVVGLQDRKEATEPAHLVGVFLKPGFFRRGRVEIRAGAETEEPEEGPEATLRILASIHRVLALNSGLQRWTAPAEPDCLTPDLVP